MQSRLLSSIALSLALIGFCIGVPLPDEDNYEVVYTRMCISYWNKQFVPFFSSLLQLIE